MKYVRPNTFYLHHIVVRKLPRDYIYEPRRGELSLIKINISCHDRLFRITVLMYIIIYATFVNVAQLGVTRLVVEHNTRTSS